MPSIYRHLGPSELLPRYIFAENLYQRRRVLELNSVAATNGQSAQFLVSRGAKSVVAADADVQAVTEAQKTYSDASLRFRSDSLDDLESASFDLILASDLSIYLKSPQALQEILRLLAKDGTLLGGLRNPSGLALANLLETDASTSWPTYGRLMDSLTPHFKCIEVATQSPLLGYQLAFERSDGLQVDGTLSGATEAAYYVVLASAEPIRPLDPTWVQLPVEPLAFTHDKLDEANRRARDWQARHDTQKEVSSKAEAARELESSRIGTLNSELTLARAQIDQLSAQIALSPNNDECQRSVDALVTEVAALKLQLEGSFQREAEAVSQVTALKSRIQAADDASWRTAATVTAAAEALRAEQAKRAELEVQVNQMIAKVEELRRREVDALSKAADLESQLGMLQNRVDRQTRESESATEREKQWRAKADETSQKLVSATEKIDSLEAKIRALESDLREQGARHRRLEAEYSIAIDTARQRVTALETERDLLTKDLNLAHSERESERRAMHLQVETQRRDFAAMNSERVREREAAAVERIRLENQLAQQQVRFEMLQSDLTESKRQLGSVLGELQGARDLLGQRIAQIETDRTRLNSRAPLTQKTGVEVGDIEKLPADSAAAEALELVDLKVP